MLDFLIVSTRIPKKGTVEIYPKFVIGSSTDLMIRGGDFYAVWDEEKQLWSTDEQTALQLIDRELDKYAEEHKKDFPDQYMKVLHMWDSESGSIDKWHKFVQKQLRDRFHPLDEKLIFSNSATTKKDYASRRLSYPFENCPIPAYEELISTLYSPEEREKLEWAIGSIVSGDSKFIQKFIVMYGAPGTGKSTILNIIQDLFDGYYSVFDSQALASSSNAFALESFRSNPLVAIQHDGDLSHLENTPRLNSIVSHEEMTVNEKFKAAYSVRFNSFIIMGTNKPVRITDAKSGLLRRLIDVSPSGNKVPKSKYVELTSKVKFELGGIASHCLDIYKSNPAMFDDYIPLSMLGASNDFYNFVLDSFDVFKKQDNVSLKQAWEMYKIYCEDAKVNYPYPQRAFKEELKNYFKEFKDRAVLEDETRIRNYYVGFISEKFEYEQPVEIDIPDVIDFPMDCVESKLDEILANCPAQYASANETPMKKWAEVTTKLSDLSTNRLHYVMPPENHIVIDFDIKDDKGNKSFKLNAEAAAKWPKTYAELSKGGNGIHLHYIYNGDVNKLSRVYDCDIEIKVFTGNSSLRRRVSRCNDLPIATISSGLPLKEEGKMVNFDSLKNERSLRTVIKKNLNKEYHGATKPSVDFIYKVLEDAYNGGMKYDVTDMRQAVLCFASESSHQADYCIKLVNKMKFKSDDPSENKEEYAEDEIIFFDVEIFPNLFVVCYKIKGHPVVKLVNPGADLIEWLIKYRLVGFNNRKYDNHILYARLLGYTNEQLYNLSKRIIQDKAEFFGEAYNLSYTDIYDYAAKKQSLKKWEIELGIHHQELGFKWDEPVPEDKWDLVADYCANDVEATEAVFDATSGDFKARQILAEIAGMTPNDTTNTLTTRIIFGREKHPQLVYTDLSETFPGYKYEKCGDDNKSHNMYRGTDLGFGGYVYADMGMFGNVALIDIQSLHPNSIRNMNTFGDYTQNFNDLLDTRLYIKHKEYDKAKKLFDGKLARYLDDPAQAKQLSQALKIAINSVYGLTSANFENPFRDIRNVNNIVALRGALFMRTLQDEVTNRGYKVMAIRTDSMKIADADKDIIDFCMQFANQYGYVFEFEAFYEKICLVTKADYAAQYASKQKCIDIFGFVPDDNEDHAGEWTATGAQFQQPYVFKTLFSNEKIEFEDMCETKSVKTAIYLDMNETLGADEHDYQFVGRVGQFCPIAPGKGGGRLVAERADKDGNIKYDSVTGAKDYRWLESEMVRNLGREKDIDISYYCKLVDEAVSDIGQYGDVEWFTSEDPYYPHDEHIYPF